MDAARAEVDTPWGRVTSAWRREEAGGLLWEVTIPANAEAVARIPCDDPAAVREGGTPLEESMGVRVMGREAGRIICALAAGRYCFS